LDQAHHGRKHILGEMAKAMTGARTELGEHAPRIETIKIPVDKIREVIGSGGSVIREIVAESGAKIDIEDDGTIKIASANKDAIDKAMARIKGITQEPEVGTIYKGKVVKLMEFGAFVNFFGSKDGLVHVSQISAAGRINHPNEVLKEGQEVWVKLLGFDDRGKTRLSMKIIDQNTGVELPRAEGEPDPMEQQESRGPRPPRSGGGGERRGPRPPRRD
jgi:polyribonucleotide nucleotidyltransferase